MADDSIEYRIKQSLVKDLKLNLDPQVIPNDIPLVGKGLGLDSVSILQLVGAIEREFDISVDDADISRELFTDISTLGVYVRKKLNTHEK